LARFYFLLCLGLGFAAAVAPVSARETARLAIANVHVADLPKEARATLALIKEGGPFPYPRDGGVFGNFEHRLPVRERGYYREYTVPTPGARDRGARRVIAGRNGEFYYTDDHYRTFRRIRE
jgi:ribonuclease T1